MKNLFRVLVCGGRAYSNYDVVRYNIGLLVQAHGGNLIICEGGANGADTLARKVADEIGVNCITYWANWRKYGKSAGPIRNRLMFEHFQPHLVMAFPGGRGTANMCSIAETANTKVFKVPT